MKGQSSFSFLTHFPDYYSPFPRMSEVLEQGQKRCMSDAPSIWNGERLEKKHSLQQQSEVHYRLKLRREII